MPETSTGSSEGNCSRFDVNTRYMQKYRWSSRVGSTFWYQNPRSSFCMPYTYVCVCVCVCADTMAEFQHGLCGCFGNVHVCIITFACPCYTAGRLAEITGRSCILHSLLYGFCPCISCWFFMCCIRRDIRQSKNIAGSRLGDLCVHFWCDGCALCQEARETNAIGGYAADGGQVMERAWNDDPGIVAVNDDDATAAYKLNFTAIFHTTPCSNAFYFP